MANDKQDILCDLLNQALKNPEPGGVNFNILRDLLGTILKHLGIANLNPAEACRSSLPEAVTNFDSRLQILEKSLEELKSAQEIGNVCLERIEKLESDLASKTSQIENLSNKPEELERSGLNIIPEAEDTIAQDQRSEEEKLMEELPTENHAECTTQDLVTSQTNLEPKIVEMEQRILEMEESVKSQNISTDFANLNAKVDEIQRVLDTQTKTNENDSKKHAVSIERLKMLIGDLEDELDKSKAELMNMKENISAIALEKVSTADLKASLRECEFQIDKENVMERNELKEAVNVLQLDTESISKRLKAIEILVKSKLSRLDHLVGLKADKDELQSLRSHISLDLEKLHNRLRRLLPSDLLDAPDGPPSDAAGFRRKMLFHCISCDKPVLFDKPGRTNTNYVDPPYLKIKDVAYDVYQRERSVGGNYTVTKPSHIKSGNSRPTLSHNTDRTEPPDSPEQVENGNLEESNQENIHEVEDEDDQLQRAPTTSPKYSGVKNGRELEESAKSNENKSASRRSINSADAPVKEEERDESEGEKNEEQDVVVSSKQDEQLDFPNEVHTEVSNEEEQNASMDDFTESRDDPE